MATCNGLTINPTSLLQNPSQELEPTESRLFNDSSADHHLSLTAIYHMAINETGNGESPSQTASVTSSSVVISLGSQADPTLCRGPHFLHQKPIANSSEPDKQSYQNRYDVDCC